MVDAMAVIDAQNEIWSPRTALTNPATANVDGLRSFDMTCSRSFDRGP